MAMFCKQATCWSSLCTTELMPGCDADAVQTCSGAGMLLDVKRWLPEHPGGSTIIPKQGLNHDCARFFEVRASIGTPPLRRAATWLSSAPSCCLASAKLCLETIHMRIACCLASRVTMRTWSAQGRSAWVCYHMTGRPIAFAGVPRVARELLVPERVLHR